MESNSRGLIQFSKCRIVITFEQCLSCCRVLIGDVSVVVFSLTFNFKSKKKKCLLRSVPVIACYRTVSASLI